MGILLNAVMINDQGGDKNVTITIEGKHGKVTLLFETEGMQDDRIKSLSISLRK